MILYRDHLGGYNDRFSIKRVYLRELNLTSIRLLIATVNRTKSEGFQQGRHRRILFYRLEFISASIMFASREYPDTRGTHHATIRQELSHPHSHLADPVYVPCHSNSRAC